MPRASSKHAGTSKKRLRTSSSRSHALKSPHLSREDQLASQLMEVIEPAAPIPKTFEERTPPTPAEVAPHPTDGIRSLDAVVLSSLKGSHDTRVRKPVKIRFEKHDASPYVVQTPKQAKPFVPVPRIQELKHIRKWVAPFEAPPSIDRVIAEVGDLHVSSVDPRLFVEQFTPAEAEDAYRQRFGWFARLREPFIRWEVVFVKREPAQSSQRATFRIEGQPIQINVPSLMEEQFTETASEELPIAEYKAPWYERFIDWIGRSERRAVNEVKALEREAEAQEDAVIIRTEEAWGVPMVVPRLVPHRVLLGLLGLLAVVSLPAGAVSLSRSFGDSYARVHDQSLAAVDEVKGAMQGSGGASWEQASSRFQAADQALSHVNAVALALAQALPQTRDRLTSAHGLLEAGDSATQAAHLLTQGIAAAFSHPVTHMDERLQIFTTYLDAATPRLEDADQAIQTVQVKDVPQELQPQVTELQSALALGRQSLQDVRDMATFALAALGHDRPRTYLVLFQNQTELRPTGGFMGSYAEVTLDQGDIQHLSVPGGGPYDLRSQLTVRVLPPKPLQLVDARWEFQDANWFPDFPTAAKKIEWFWSKAGQPTLDGVITVNSSVLQKMLTVTGPIEMPDYGKTITADNYLLETQKAVELDYDKTENKPKKFIGDLLAKMLVKMQGADQETLIKFAGVMTEALETKDIQIAMNDADEEAQVEAWGWNSRLAPTPGDMLSVIEANIAGQKTDGVIDEQVHHRAQIQSDGSIIDTVTLERTHNGQAGELFQGANNVEYVRVYVPQGSQLLSASGFDPPESHFFQQTLAGDPVDDDVASLVKNAHVDPATSVDVTDEFGYTAFGGWLQLAPGAHSVTTFQYRLPFTTQDLAQAMASGTNDGAGKAAYLLLLNSQSGKPNRTIDSEVTVPDGWNEAWSHTQFASSTALGWDRDRVVAHLYNTQHDENAPTSP